MHELKRLGAVTAPLSYAQERLWLIDAAAPGSATYNVPILLRWDGCVDVAALRTALSAVVARHEVLRTSYELHERGPVQIVNPAAPVPVEVVDLDQAPEAEQRFVADALDRAREPFDLSAGPPLRCVAWRGVPGGDAVLLLIHHIAVDGWSFATLFGDLATGYGAALAGQSPELPEPVAQYTDFAAWERASYGDPAALRRLSERADELLRVPAGLALAGSRPRPVPPDGARRGAEHVFEVPEQTRQGVASLARRLRVTPFVVFFAAFQVVLWRWSDRTEFAVGAITANRPSGMEDMVGFFANTVPLRCHVQPDWTFVDLCAQVRTEAFRSLTYQRIPFDQLTARVTAARGTGRGTLVDVGLAFQDIPAPAVATAYWKSLRFLPTDTAKFDLMLILENDRYGQQGLVGTVEYDLDRYPADIGPRIGEAFGAVLATVLTDTDQPLGRLSVPGGAGPTAGPARGPDDETAGHPASGPASERVEIERLLGQQEAVRAAAVRHLGEQRRPVAYVELAESAHRPRSREDLIRPLRRLLPSTALPEEIRVVAALPPGSDTGELTAVPYRLLPESSAGSTEPAGDRRLTDHQRLAAHLFVSALAQVGHATGRLDAARLDPGTDFFVLGGHSLLAVTMLAEAGRRHGLVVSPRDFLGDPTVGGLGRLLASTAAPAAATVASASSVEPGDRYPATAAQQRFWFIDRITELRPAYLMPTVVEYTGVVDHAALCRALDTTLARHPALRSRFELDRRRRQVFYRTDGSPPAASLTNASGWTEARLREHLSELCWSGFDLGTQAPVRAEVVAVGDRTLLVLVAHHIVVDGRSRDLLMHDIVEAYRADVDNRPARLVDPSHPGPLHQADQADEADEAGRAGSARIAEVVAALTGAPTDVQLPHDRPRPAIQSTLGATRTTALGPRLTARLRTVLAESGCTTFMAATTLLAATLARHGGQRDFLFAFPWAGREIPGSADAVGMFVNTLVLRADLRGDPTWREVLARVRESSTLTYRNATVPFEAIAAALHPDRDLSRPPCTPVYLSLLDATPAAVPLAPDGTARLLPLDPIHLKYELELQVTEHRDDVELAVSYAVALFDRDTIAGLLAGLVTCAADLVDDPHARPL